MNRKNLAYAAFTLTFAILTFWFPVACLESKSDTPSYQAESFCAEFCTILNDCNLHAADMWINTGSTCYDDCTGIDIKSNTCFRNCSEAATQCYDPSGTNSNTDCCDAFNTCVTNC